MSLLVGGQILASSSGSSRPEFYQPINTSGATVQAGQLAAKDGAGTGIILAIATALATEAIGFAESDIGAGGSGVVRTDGTLDLADWTAATGAAALVPGSTYWLDAVTTGRMSTAAPAAAPGVIAQAVGKALSASTFSIEIQSPVVLA